METSYSASKLYIDDNVIEEIREYRSNIELNLLENFKEFEIPLSILKNTKKLWVTKIDTVSKANLT